MSDSLEVDQLPGFRASGIERSLVRISAHPGWTVVALEDGRVIGFCTPFLDELRVHPDHRRRGHGSRVVPEALRIQRERGRDLTLYVPLHLPASTAFAEQLGFRYHSSQWQFSLAPDVTAARPSISPDVATRLVDPREIEDLDGWVAFMLASFEGHPSPTSFTVDGVRRRHETPGFDGSGVLVVAPADAPDELVAFVRVESYPDGDTLAGEIGLIGVVPAWRRRVLGRDLLRWGIAELPGRGVGPIELTVEAANDSATQLYRAHVFKPTVEWPHWSLTAD